MVKQTLGVKGGRPMEWRGVKPLASGAFDVLG